MANLKDIDKNNTFKVPEDYFDDFTREMQTKIAEENLKSTYGNENPFSVPENYFEDLRIKKEKRLSIGTRQKLRPYLAIAASIVFVFIIWQIALNALDNDTKVVDVDTVVMEEQSLYAGNIDLSDIDQTDLENEFNIYLNETDLSTIISMTDTTTNGFELNIEKEAIYDYLIDYSDDLSEYDEILAQL
jgi:hypothetical protein